MISGASGCLRYLSFMLLQLDFVNRLLSQLHRYCTYLRTETYFVPVTNLATSHLAFAWIFIDLCRLVQDGLADSVVDFHKINKLQLNTSVKVS